MYRALAGVSPSPASVAAIVFGIEAASQEFRNVSFLIHCLFLLTCISKTSKQHYSISSIK